MASEDPPAYAYDHVSCFSCRAVASDWKLKMLGSFFRS